MQSLEVRALYEHCGILLGHEDSVILLGAVRMLSARSLNRDLNTGFKFFCCIQFWDVVHRNHVKET